ncbi:MAG: hypothetical protein KDK27_13995 [Leptospiraceae bacterium]|nr:hypothetical protein [Leptospiraceae bacterium]
MRYSKTKTDRSAQRTGSHRYSTAAFQSDGFIDTRHTIRANLRERQRMEAVFGPEVIRLARRFHWCAFLPGLLSGVHVQGLDCLPLAHESAPILAFAHKKLLDVLVIIEILAGRPLDRFHNITIIGQAGLFNGIYAYRDLIPNALKTPRTAPALAAVSSRAARTLERWFRLVNAHPVYREGKDVPDTESAYVDPHFGGAYILGKDFSDFKKFAARETRDTIIQVLNHMNADGLNRSLILLPEGGYGHDGSIKELHEFVALAAHRKQKPTYTITITYDELCPDRLGRIASYVRICKPALPPTERTPDSTRFFLNQLRNSLVHETVIVPSHALAAGVRYFRNRRQTFGWNDFMKRLYLTRDRLLQSGQPAAPTLSRDDMFKKHVSRFRSTYGARWLRRGRGGLICHEPSIGRYNQSERSVDDVEWNYNHVRHIPDLMTD